MSRVATYVCQRSSEAVVCLLYVARLPVALSKGAPSFNEGRIVLHGLRETLLCLSVVVCQNIKSPSLQTPVLNFWYCVMKCVQKSDGFFHSLFHVMSFLPGPLNFVVLKVVCIEVVQVGNSCLCACARWIKFIQT